MTREEAKREIDSLDYYLQNHTGDYGEESHTAMMMAIKALEQEPILDKIKAEIDYATEIHSDGEFYIKNIDVKRIIDKYTEPRNDMDKTTKIAESEK